MRYHLLDAIIASHTRVQSRGLRFFHDRASPRKSKYASRSGGSRDTRTGVSFLLGVSSNYGTRGWSEMHATRTFDRY